MISIWRTMLYGMIIGGTMMIPGASGGTMAMVLGIYDQLVAAVSSFRQKKKENIRFLLSFIIGGGTGIILFSLPLSWVLNHFPMETKYFFLGAVLGGVPVIYKKAGRDNILSAGAAEKSRDVIAVLSGVLAVFLLELIPTDRITVTYGQPLLQASMLLLIGVPVASALVLPGISVSHFLLIFGLYQPLLDAVEERNLIFLCALAGGVLLGVVLVTKVLEYLLERFPRQSYLVILGFMVGSLGELFPGIPSLTEMPVCILLFCTGFFIMYLLSKKS